MSFMYPLGLLGLIGIPVIIIIYILQSKFTEQTVNSNYLWHLSEKFMKRKNPLSGITGLISLILQILLVVIISLALARPIFTLPNAAKNYCFVLDSSSSMNMEEGRKTRYELAKDEIIKTINKTSDGSTYSLICVSNEPVQIFDSVKDKKSAIELVKELSPSHLTVKQEDLLSTAQAVFDKDSSSSIYLVTDKDYESHNNISIIDVGNEDVDNYAVFNMTYSHLGGEMDIKADIISYTSGAKLEIKAYIDGKESGTFNFNVEKGAAKEISVKVKAEAFSSLKLEVTNKDGYMLDNSITAYNTNSDKSYNVLIVSNTGFFLEAVIDAIADSRIDVITPDKYETVTEKYGLYIFDSYTPASLPDGAVWLINSDRSIENSGFGVKGKVSIPNADVIEKSKSTATNARKLLEGIGDSDIYITDYVKYSGMYLGFYTLFTYDSNPIIFAGANGLGNRQVVFGFDLHKSDFALSTDFVILARNLLEYSFPSIVDETSYTVGQEAVVNIVSNAENLKAISPSGKDIFIETDGATAGIVLEEIGTYRVSAEIGGVETVYSLYSGADSNESTPAVTEADFSLAGEKTESNQDGEFDPLTILFICLAIIFIADWGVYCYEKYQLR